MRAYTPPIRTLAVSYPRMMSDPTALLASRFSLPTPIVPDFSYARDWPLALKGCVYAMHFTPFDDERDSPDPDGFARLAELVGAVYDRESPDWPYSIADCIRAIGRVYTGEPERGLADLRSDARSKLKQILRETPIPRAYAGSGVIPTYPCLKTWLAGGLPVVAGLAVRDDWDACAKQGYHPARMPLEPEEYGDGLVVVVVGWDDLDSTLTIRYLDGDWRTEPVFGRIDVNEVLGPHARIELCAIYPV